MIYNKEKGGGADDLIRTVLPHASGKEDHHLRVVEEVPREREPDRPAETQQTHQHRYAQRPLHLPGLPGRGHSGVSPGREAGNPKMKNRPRTRSVFCQ